MNRFTVIGFYPDTLQRFSTHVEAQDADDAEMACIRNYSEVAICGVIAGCHNSVDTRELVQLPAL